MKTMTLVRGLSVVSLGAVVFALGCHTDHDAASDSGIDTAHDAGTDAAPVALTGAVQMNDVSILLPLASSQQDFDAYTKAEDVGLGGPLVPKDIFTTFNVPGKTAVGTGGPELDYASLRIVSLRLDPCFANIGPVTDVNSCKNQLRLVMQALTFSNGATTAEDTALHAFYSLTRDQLVEAVNEITALRAANGGTTDLGPLAVHPIIESQGIAGPMATGLAAIVKKYAGSGNITRMTRMYSSSDFWDFNGIDVTNGVAVPMVIPATPDNGTVVSFTEPVTLMNFNGSFVPAPTAADDIALLTNVSSANDASPQDRQNAFDAMLKIESPSVHSPNTIDCASCHVSEVARVINSSVWGLTAQGDSFAFVPPSSVPKADLALTAPVVPGTSNKNFHSFSYRATEARINQRVVNETAVVVDYLNGLAGH